MSMLSRYALNIFAYRMNITNKIETCGISSTVEEEATAYSVEQHHISTMNPSHQEEADSGSDGYNNEEELSNTHTASRWRRDDGILIAENTLHILKSGWYDAVDNTRVVVSQDVKFAVTNTVLYPFDAFNLKATAAPYINSSTVLHVTHCTTLQAARSLSSQGFDVGVLNFASAKNPGGGFLRGANAQEESIARSSALYWCISQDSTLSYYQRNRNDRLCLYTHTMIYSPRVPILKNDVGTLLLRPYYCGIVTCPAPNAGVASKRHRNWAWMVRDEMDERIRRILLVFQTHMHDALVLGAWGCGVFQCDPYMVAALFKRHLKSPAFKNSFKHITFAILDEKMCAVFNEVFADTEPIENLLQEIAQRSERTRRSKVKGKEKTKLCPKKNNKQHRHH
ncbi:unnamed protein product [Didymodactylos carnosus]|uniref:Microbial-type PARG catalytic domain-containing protein n=1 Tax=Didymodactylos carnosus TaxID=1234261 RepID=A0A8S2EMN2_9BILA|nr:unnamed protein product [Didymodactylos carnosus]CAF4070699.1 unnamed protein product [Didymodactylos carnosus]